MEGIIFHLSLPIGRWLVRLGKNHFGYIRWVWCMMIGNRVGCVAEWYGDEDIRMNVWADSIELSVEYFE